MQTDSSRYQTMPLHIGCPTGRKTYTFTLWSRDIFTYQEKPLRQYEMTLSEMLRSYYDVAEKYYKDHKMNKPHFAISCENPFFRYWNFCI